MNEHFTPFLCNALLAYICKANYHDNTVSPVANLEILLEVCKILLVAIAFVREISLDNAIEWFPTGIFHRFKKFKMATKWPPVKRLFEKIAISCQISCSHMSNFMFFEVKKSIGDNY